MFYGEKIALSVKDVHMRDAALSCIHCGLLHMSCYLGDLVNAGGAKSNGGDAWQDNTYAKDG